MFGSCPNSFPEGLALVLKRSLVIFNYPFQSSTRAPKLFSKKAKFVNFGKRSEVCVAKN